jgi:hypothetical protein
MNVWLSPTSQSSAADRSVMCMALVFEITEFGSFVLR